MHSGNEPFINGNKKTDYTVIDFWKWAYGDFINNMQRGVLAEHIVATAIGLIDIPKERHRVMWKGA